MCTDADHARSVESELLSLLREQVRVSKKLFAATQMQTQVLTRLIEALSEEQSDSDEDQPHTYIDGKPIRY